MRPTRSAFLFCALLPLFVSSSAVAWLLPSAAHAEVRRCTAPNGEQVFTDRRCEDMGATANVGRDATFPGLRLPYRGGCSRNLQDLVFEMTTAIDTHDVNRLASLYHWVGMSGRTSVGVMSRLDAIAQRPLVDIVALQPERPPAIDGIEGAAPDGDSDTGADDYAPPNRNPAPFALRVEQTLGNGSTPSRTVFGLRRHLGCWWVTL